MADAGGTPEERLIAQGWTRQFNTDEPRLSEAVEMYEQMGLEVRLEPVVVDPDSEVCQICYEQDCHRYQTIWTRPKGESREDEDLF
ncbi:MAG TPA: hypothetical protein VMW58_08250 [Anaerolineae bacterium]|nr:hypothetical protein [Anaerolineae bacterium]